MTDDASFFVSFNGPGVEEGRIDVRDLAPALLSLAKLIDAANIAVYGEKQPIKIEAKAISTGSFEVLLQAVPAAWDALTTLIDGTGAQHAKTLLEWLGLFGVTPAATVGGYSAYIDGWTGRSQRAS
jgi:hypothetical protein